MYKYLVIAGFALMSSSGVIAKETTSKESSKQVKEVSLIERLFTTNLYLCDAWPDCDIDGEVGENEKMARESEQQKQPYQDNKNKTQTNSNKDG